MGQVVRLHLELDRPEEGAPASLIAKIPTLVKQNRAIGELMGAYEREILFYDSLAPRLSLRSPRTFYSAMEGSVTSQREAEGAAMLDRYPMWLIRLMMVFVTWLVSRRTRRYVLLIEDLQPGRVGDQVAGCRPEEADRILREIAKVHAQFWRSDELGDNYWLRAQNLNPRTMHCVYLKNRPGFGERFRDNAPVSFEPTLRWLDENAVALLRSFHGAAPETLLHGDMRLDNVSFSPPEPATNGNPAEEPIVFFDWQLTSRGPAAYDVAYFLSGALAADAPADTVAELVRGYHAALVAEGIDDYPLEDCLRDYRRALLSVLHRISSTDTMEFGDDRGFRLIARTLARLEGLDYDALLDS